MPLHDLEPPPLDGDERTLLETRLTLACGDRKRIIPLEVEVPAGTEALAVFFDYRPRWSRDRELNQRAIEAAVDAQIEAARAAGVAVARDHRERALARLANMLPGMRTLLNLVLHDPGGALRGRWDQNSGEAVKEDLIGVTSATPGFVAGPLPAGRWTASIEVHEILVEPCELSLRVAARRPSAAAASSRADVSVRPRFAAPLCEFAAPLPRGWLRGELHCHSVASDGLFAPELLVERARAVGLDFLALTDHNSVAGLGALEQAPIPIIPGCEVTTFAGHFISLGVRRAVPWYSGDRVLGTDELAAAVHEAGGLFGLAHPHALGDPICVGCRLQAPVRAADIDLVEVWSRGSSDPLARAHALATLDDLWRRGRRVTAVAGRDWHGPGQERGPGGHRLPATCLRAQPELASLLSALRRGACYLSVGPHLELEVSAEGRSAGLGEELVLGQAAAATVRARIGPLDQPARLRLLSDGRCLREEPVGPGEARFEHQDLPAGAMRLELWSDEGDLLLLSSPMAVLAH